MSMPDLIQFINLFAYGLHRTLRPRLSPPLIVLLLGLYESHLKLILFIWVIINLKREDRLKRYSMVRFEKKYSGLL